MCKAQQLRSNVTTECMTILSPSLWQTVIMFW